MKSYAGRVCSAPCPKLGVGKGAGVADLFLIVRLAGQRIALDAMGGDKGPQVVVEGLGRFLGKNPDARVLLLDRRE